MQDNQYIDSNGNPMGTVVSNILIPVPSTLTNDPWPQTDYYLSALRDTEFLDTSCPSNCCSSECRANREGPLACDEAWPIAQMEPLLQPLGCYTGLPANTNNQFQSPCKEPDASVKSPFDPVRRIPGPAFSNKNGTASDSFQDMTNGLMPHLVRPELSTYQRIPYR